MTRKLYVVLGSATPPDVVARMIATVASQAYVCAVDRCTTPAGVMLVVDATIAKILNPHADSMLIAVGCHAHSEGITKTAESLRHHAQGCMVEVDVPDPADIECDA